MGRKNVGVDHPQQKQPAYQTPPQQIIRPTHHIEPEIVRIPASSSSLGYETSSRTSIPSEQKITTNYVSNNTRTIESSTSINPPQHTHHTNVVQYTNPSDYGYNRAYTPSNEPLAPRALGYQSTVTRHETTARSPYHTNYQTVQGHNTTTTTTTTNNANNNNYYSSSNMANYKVYTPEEYAAKYGNSTTTKVVTQTLSPVAATKEYGTAGSAYQQHSYGHQHQSYATSSVTR